MRLVYVLGVGLLLSGCSDKIPISGTAKLEMRGDVEVLVVDVKTKSGADVNVYGRGIRTVETKADDKGVAHVEIKDVDRNEGDLRVIMTARKRGLLGGGGEMDVQLVRPRGVRFAKDEKKPNEWVITCEGGRICPGVLDEKTFEATFHSVDAKTTIELGGTRGIFDGKNTIKLAIDPTPFVSRPLSEWLADGATATVDLKFRAVFEGVPPLEATLKVPATAIAAGLPRYFAKLAAGEPMLLAGETASPTKPETKGAKTKPVKASPLGFADRKIVLARPGKILGGDPKTLADVEIVGIVETKPREVSCGKYTSSTGASTTVSVTANDVEIRLVERRSAKVLAKTTASAGGTCPSVVGGRIPTPEASNVEEKDIVATAERLVRLGM